MNGLVTGGLVTNCVVEQTLPNTDSPNIAAKGENTGVEEKMNSDDGGGATNENGNTSDAEKGKWPSNIENIEKMELANDNSVVSLHESSCTDQIGRDPSDVMSNQLRETTQMEIDSDPNSGERASSDDLDSGNENMEVDDGDRRETLKRQRESSSASSECGSLTNIAVATPDEDNTYKLLSKVFKVQWRNVESLSNNSYYKIEDLPFNESCNTTDLVQAILIEISMQLTKSKSYEESLKLYNQLKGTEASLNAISSGQSEEEFPKEILASQDRTTLLLCYVIKTYQRLIAEEKRLANGSVKDLLEIVRHQLLQHTTLILTNVFDCEDVTHGSTNALLKPFLLKHCLPYGFLSDLVIHCYLADGTSGIFRRIFEPIIRSIWEEMNCYSSLACESNYKAPLEVLDELCQIGVGKTVRPICQLVSILFFL